MQRQANHCTKRNVAAITSSPSSSLRCLVPFVASLCRCVVPSLAVPSVPFVGCVGKDEDEPNNEPTNEPTNQPTNDRMDEGRQ